MRKRELHRNLVRLTDEEVNIIYHALDVKYRETAAAVADSEPKTALAMHDQLVKEIGLHNVFEGLRNARTESVQTMRAGGED